MKYVQPYYTESQTRSREVHTIHTHKYIPIHVHKEEREVGGSWRGYIVKEDQNAYWSPYYHELVRRINQINQENGIIPDDMLHLKCWSKTRKDADFTTRLEKLAGKRGGDTDAQ